MYMSPDVQQELSDLVEELIEATDDHVYWLGPVRQTSLELRELLTSRSQTKRGIFSTWKCPVEGCRFGAVKPIDHPCPL